MKIDERSYVDAAKLIIASRERVFRYFVVGILNTAVGLSTFPLLFYTFRGFGLHYLLIMSVSQVVNVVFAFLTQKFLVFRTPGYCAMEFGKFISFHLIVVSVNFAALPLLVEVAGIEPAFAQTVFAVFVVLTSYFWHSRITFFKNSGA